MKETILLGEWRRTCFGIYEDKRDCTTKNKTDEIPDNDANEITIKMD